mgnify:CR=1 FL=1
MSKFEKNTIDVRGDGKVILYHRDDVVSNPKWQCRVSVDGAVGYYVFSTKTVDRDIAERKGLDKYFELRNKVDKGGSLKGKTVNQVFEEWKTYVHTKITNRTKSNIEKNTIAVVEDTVVQFLGKKRTDEISNADIQDMVVWRYSDERYKESFENKEYNYSKLSQSNNETSRYSVSTMRSHRGAINQFFRFCKERDYITQDFNFDIPKGKSNPRPEFSLKDYQKLTKYMRTWVDEKSFFKGTGYDNPKTYRERFYLQHYILIMSNTGMRVGEARGLRWCDLESVVLPNEGERLLLKVDGKTGKRDTIANQGTEVYIKRLYQNRMTELNMTEDKFDMNEHIFCHPDGKAINSYKVGYKTLLEKCKLRITNDGEYRTIYSLRHTYATMRINEVPIYQLAINMGTSVKMIEEYYSHAKTKDPKFAETITKGNQKGLSKVLPF